MSNNRRSMGSFSPLSISDFSHDRGPRDLPRNKYKQGFPQAPTATLDDVQRAPAAPTKDEEEDLEVMATFKDLPHALRQRLLNIYRFYKQFPPEIHRDVHHSLVTYPNYNEMNDLCARVMRNEFAPRMPGPPMTPGPLIDGFNIISRKCGFTIQLFAQVTNVSPTILSKWTHGRYHKDVTFAAACLIRVALDYWTEDKKIWEKELEQEAEKELVENLKQLSTRDLPNNYDPELKTANKKPLLQLTSKVLDFLHSSSHLVTLLFIDGDSESSFHQPIAEHMHQLAELGVFFYIAHSWKVWRVEWNTISDAPNVQFIPSNEAVQHAADIALSCHTFAVLRDLQLDDGWVSDLWESRIECFVVSKDHFCLELAAGMRYFFRLPVFTLRNRNYVDSINRLLDGGRVSQEDTFVVRRQPAATSVTATTNTGPAFEEPSFRGEERTSQPVPVAGIERASDSSLRALLGLETQADTASEVNSNTAQGPIDPRPLRRSVAAAKRSSPLPATMMEPSISSTSTALPNLPSMVPLMALAPNKENLLVMLQKVSWLLHRYHSFDLQKFIDANELDERQRLKYGSWKAILSESNLKLIDAEIVDGFIKRRRDNSPLNDPADLTCDLPASEYIEEAPGRFSLRMLLELVSNALDATNYFQLSVFVNNPENAGKINALRHPKYPSWRSLLKDESILNLIHCTVVEIGTGALYVVRRGDTTAMNSIMAHVRR